MADIKNPTTYGEYYWATQVEAQKEFEETLEASVKEFIPKIYNQGDLRETIPFDLATTLDNLFAFQHPGLADIGGRFVSEVADQLVSTIMTPSMRATQYAANRMFQNVVPDPNQAIMLRTRKYFSIEQFQKWMNQSGWENAMSEFMFKIAQPFPDINQWFHWARYHGDPDNVWSTLFDKIELDPIYYPVFDWLNKQVYTTDQVTGLYRHKLIDEFTAKDQLAKIGWGIDDRDMMLLSSYSIPNATLLVQSGLLYGKTQDEIIDRIETADISPSWSQDYLDAILTKPATEDVIRYQRRIDPDLRGLDNELRKVGVHPDYFDLYRNLSYPVPPVADLITMAVREAFSPSVAARFGQYEDFPTEFATYAAQQGISEDWAKRYWAAHWSLPSITQGFEMLHRGIIDENDLRLLMRALDVMPYWRDKLIQLSYKPLTRVDVRRMFAEGVLDENEVYQSYLNIGYDADNAKRMADFTVAQTLSSLTGVTATDVVNAYSNRIIDAGDARSALRQLGIESKYIGDIIESADLQREWKLTGDKIKGIKNLYKHDQITENETRSRLSRLGLQGEQVDVLMEQWFYEPKPESAKGLSKADTLKFFKLSLIDEAQARKYLQDMGYDSTSMDLMIKSVIWSQEQTSSSE